MQVELFRGTGRVFAVVPEGRQDRLPERHGPWSAFKTLDLERSATMPGLNVEECLDDLDQHGIHVTDAHVRITEEAIG